MASIKTSISPTEAVTLINDIIELVGSYGTGSVKPNATDIGQYFAQNVKYESNGTVVGKNPSELATRWQKAQSLFPKYSVSSIIGQPVISGNQASFRYNVDYTNTAGKKGQLIVSAIISIEGGKVANWTQVLHEKGTGVWDA